MKKMLKRLCTGFLALATVVTALPTKPVHAENKQNWTESAERVGIIEKVMNDGSIGLILSILVDTFPSWISLTMPPSPKPHTTACVLS